MIEREGLPIRHELKFSIDNRQYKILSTKLKNVLKTDIHAGRMCDTYGLFAIPGMEQRICPTSGVILNQLFWAMIMEFVEQYIDRTGGDIPGVFFSAALKGGREHMHRMHELFKGNEIRK